MKIKLVSLTALGVLGTVLLSPVVNGAQVGQGLETTGTVKFEATDNETGPIVKPDEEKGEEEVIEVPEGNTGKGALRIQFVPNFKFGTLTGITSNKQEKAALALPYLDKDGKDTGKFIPPFVQVTNNSGEADLKWSLLATATAFQEVDGTGGIVPNGHTLTNAYISLEGSTLTTSQGTTADAATLAEGQKAQMIPVDNVTKISVLSAKADTNGKQVSNVFESNYQSATDYKGEITGVKLVKPAGIAARKDVTYQSTITWTLMDGK